MQSIWQESAYQKRFETLTSATHTDVLIVGGGITGLLCAYMLQNVGIDCVLVEAKRIGGGVTENTTAKITVGHGLIYDTMIKRYGVETARLYLESQIRAGENYERLCRTIDCDYEKADSYVYSMCHRRKIEKEIYALKQLGLTAEFSDAHELPMAVAGAVCVRNQAQFHPLKFLYEIADGLPIYENTKVIEYKPHKAITPNGSISFKKMIVATHFPIFNKHGGYYLKLYQHRSYVLALKGAKNINGMYVDESDKGLSFRSYRDLLLLGGGAHRTGKKGGCWLELELFAKKYYPHAEIVGKWAAQDCMTLDEIPYIGCYSPNTPDVYVATGFNKWGMTNAMVAASILCDLILRKPNPYASAFSPSRSILHPQLAVNAWESVVGWITPTVPRCPHLGCALRYNKAEHSWDCSCHGSRFSESGALFDNPATDDIRLARRRKR